MTNFTRNALTAAFLMGFVAIATPAFAQLNGAAGSLGARTVNNDAKADVDVNSSVGAADKNASVNGRASSSDATALGTGTMAQAEHSAEATAHKTVSDLNNQLGTSLQGRTRPVIGATGTSTAAEVQ